MSLLFQFLVGHALGDYVLQRDVMATSKSRHAMIFQTAGKEFPGWYYWLVSHSLVHGGLVFLIRPCTCSAKLPTCMSYIRAGSEPGTAKNWNCNPHDRAT